MHFPGFRLVDCFVLYQHKTKQNKNIFRYFLRQRKRSFQTYTAEIAVKVKQNTFKILTGSAVITQICDI